MRLKLAFEGIFFLIISQTACAQKDLDYFLQQAYTNSPLLQTNQIRSEANKLEAERIIAALKKPSVSAEINYMLSPVYSTDDGNSGFKINPSKNVSNYYGYDLSATNGGLYHGVFMLEQPLFNGERIRVASEQMSIGNQVLDNNNQVTKHQLQRLITQQYIVCLQDVEEQKAIQGIIDIISEQIKTTEKLAASGLMQQSDYKLLHIESEQHENLLNTSIGNYKTHLLSLYSLCGINDTVIIDLPPVHLSLNENQNNYSSGFTKQYQLDSIGLAVSKKYFDTKYKPLISFYSSAGLNAVYAPTAYQRLGWMAGIRLTKTFFDGGQKELNTKRTALLQQETSLNTAFFEKQNASRKASLRQQVNSLESQMQSVIKQIGEYDDLLNYYKKQIISGQISVINYITVLRSKANLQLNLATLKTNQEISINEYNYWNW
jgi:outer membrane protein TolC